jgi:tRNA dimethylallyltransferase
MKPKILIIVGPTASGKSDLAVTIAKKYNGEVISADSRQVYTGLNIGTGKITPQEMQGIPHHLLDVADPKDQFTVVEWRTQAENIITDIISRGKLPIICGGTGFYISTLIDNINLPDVSADQELRNKLKNTSATELFTLLEKVDRARAVALNQSDRNNPRRLIRALEIAQHATVAPAPVGTTHESSYNPLWIGLEVTPDILRKQIINRLEKRLHQGMIGEVQELRDNGLTPERMEELGLEYRYISRYLLGTLNIDDMKEKLATEICHYAKRQMTWFKKNKAITWFEPGDTAKIHIVVEQFLKNEDKKSASMMNIGTDNR